MYCPKQYLHFTLGMSFSKVLCFIIIYHTLSINAVVIYQFPVGGLFNAETQPTSKKTFENIVKKSDASNYFGRVFYPQVTDTYSTALEICKRTKGNGDIVALIDARPSYGICDTVCLLCNRYNITHLSLAWEPPDTLADDLYTFNYYPPPVLTSKAYATLIKMLQWDKFALLYEDEGSFVRLQDVINSWPHDQEPILYRQLDPDGDNREIFKYIFRVSQINFCVLDCKASSVRKYFKEITEIVNSTIYQSFILTALDSYTVSFEDINFNANVSTMHITQLDDARWKDMGMGGMTVSLETALTADALNHLEKAIRGMRRENPIQLEDLPRPPPICFMDSKAQYEELAWSLGSNLREAMIQLPAKGFTGNIEFDDEGRRTNIVLHYSKMKKIDNVHRFLYAGYWDSNTDTIILNEEHDGTLDRPIALDSSYEVLVVTRKGEPYIYINNGTFRGYACDLIDAIFKQIKVTFDIDLKYKFYEVEDGKYGNAIEGSKKWDGLIGDLLEHKADLAICDITVTSERNSVVDFSTPFMTLGISMLFREPDPQEPDMFSFIQPLSLDVWLYLATVYIIVSFVLLLCARMSQDDWVNPHPCNQNPESLQNIWSLYNCMWLTMGSIMTQGCDILPRAPGSRWVTGMWWFFALIVTASYTANMSTFLSNSLRSNEIDNVKTLSEQNEVSYGALYNGSTYKFFQNSNDSVYQKIWSVMQSTRPTVFTTNNADGRDRVLRSKGKYAFFMESTAIEYYTQRYCELKMVGNELDAKEYGIAMPRNSPYKGYIDIAILSLQESGHLSALKQKWWENEDNEKKCEHTEKDGGDSSSLQMKNTSGIFLVLGMGGILGLLVAIIDFLLNAHRICVKEKVTFKEAVYSEWRASLDPRALHRLAAPPRSAAPSTASASPERERSRSRAVSVLRAASSFINFDEIY